MSQFLPVDEQLDLLQKGAAEIIRVSDLRERLEREGAELIPGPPERLGTLIQVDLASWKKLITEARLQLE